MHHSLAATGNGQVWAWGANAYGQLGDGTTLDRATPVVVGGGVAGVGQVAGGARHSLAAAGARRSRVVGYSYDRLARLTGVRDTTDRTVTSTTYAYDPVGNRLGRTRSGTSTASTYDRADRLQQVGGVAVTVDAVGNLTARGSDTFQYDQANRLVQATVGGTSTTYTYDGDGRRVASTTGGVTTRFVYDINTTLPVLLADGTRKYVWGAQGLAYAVSGSGAGETIEVSHPDGLGSVRALTDSTGSVVQTYGTDEFGIVDPQFTQGTRTQPFGYTGEPVDASSGLVDLRARVPGWPR